MKKTDEYQFINEKFVVIDGVHFRLDYFYDSEPDVDDEWISGFNTSLNDNWSYGLRATFSVIVQTEEQHELISNYVWRMREKKERKIKAFQRCNCFVHNINKLKFRGMTIKHNFDVATFSAETVNRKWSPYKQTYSEEDKRIFTELDIEVNNLKNSYSSINKYNL